MDKLIKGLLKIMDGDLLFPVFQVIAAAETRSIAGYEACIRGPADSPLHTPRSLYLAAEMAGCRMRLEHHATRLAVQQFVGLGLTGRLFKRFPPLFFVGGYFSKLRDTFPERELERVELVALLTEDHQEGGTDLLKKAVSTCRRQGLPVAIDELQALTLSAKSLKWLAPDYVILSGQYIQGIHQDFTKQRLIEQLTRQFAPQTRIIACGSDNQEDYFAARNLGIELLQGHYFGDPSDQPSISLPARMFVSATDPSERRIRSSTKVEELTRALPHIAPQEGTGEVLKIFLRSPSVNSLPVVDEGRPVGMVRREYLANIFLTPFGRDLYSKSPILRFTDTNPLMVEADTSIEQVSQRITERGQLQNHQEFIIQRNGVYYGVGSILDLLRQITAMQMRDASHANPLTGLPGNVRIEEEIQLLLEQAQPFTACYFDLDNFKPFNDHYGYKQGDEVIRLVADLIAQEIDPSEDFVGHVGGDDFIALWRAPDWQARCERILQGFGERALGFYSEEDRQRGGIAGKDRQGNDLFFGILALSIGAVQPHHCDSHHCVAALASGAKKEAKRIPGNSLFLERRSHAG